MIVSSATGEADQGVPGPGRGALLDPVWGAGREPGLVRSHCPVTSLGPELMGVSCIRSCVATSLQLLSPTSAVGGSGGAETGNYPRKNQGG